MASDRQIAANRINARKSTGPKTAAGRAAVRNNALTHGLTASTLVIEGESRPEFEALLAAVRHEHQPETPTEEALVAQILMSIWRLRRCYNLDAGFFTVGRIETRDELSGFPNLEPGDRLALVVCRDVLRGNVLTTISRYEVRLLGSLIKALQLLYLLRKMCPVKIENQTQSEPAPSVAKPQSPQEDNPSQPADPPVPTPGDDVLK